MKGVGLMQATEDLCFVKTHRLQGNVALYCTAAGEGHAFITGSVLRGEGASASARELYSMIAQLLQQRRMAVVQERIFGSLTARAAVLRERKAALSERHIPADGPLTYVEGMPMWGEGMAGVIIHAVSADAVWTIMEGENPCGRGWIRNGSTALVLQNIQGQAGTRSEQVRAMLDRADGILRRNGASFKDVARTWFYLSGILNWYPDFNRARSEKYGAFGVMPGAGDIRLLLPASTGIGAAIPSDAAASMDLLAVVEGVNMTSPVRKLTNRKQLDAFRYGAAFSRGAVIEDGDVALIHVSGTAAIDEHGVSLHPGDIRSQIDCTFDKIEALLGQEGTDLSDISAATVFVKFPEHAPLFWEMAVDRGLEDFPAVCVAADVCREELLFEIDGEAVVRREATCV
jgi:enamine deaminase RidA (YjgF/YER057c/UK114 family)